VFLKLLRFLFCFVNNTFRLLWFVKLLIFLAANRVSNKDIYKNVFLFVLQYCRIRFAYVLLRRKKLLLVFVSDYDGVVI